MEIREGPASPKPNLTQSQDPVSTNDTLPGKKMKF